MLSYDQCVTRIAQADAAIADRDASRAPTHAAVDRRIDGQIAQLRARRAEWVAERDRLAARGSAPSAGGPFVLMRGGQYLQTNTHWSATPEPTDVQTYVYRGVAHRYAVAEHATVQTWGEFEQDQYTKRHAAPATQPAWYAEEARLLDES